MMSSYRYHCSDCGKTYIGPQLPARMTCNCEPPKQVPGRLHTITIPLSSDLTQVLSSSEAADLRSTLCKRWGIVNKSHKQHGSNFSSNQTVVNLIHDIVAPVQGGLWALVRDEVIKDYSYDIETHGMA